ncbi:MAG: hypothetical protein Q8O46_01520 [bacterium]|nr:hypothetical protein [bacterium]
MEGTEVQTSKERALAVLITHGTAAWVRQCHAMMAQKTTPGTKVQLHIPRHTAEILTILLANLIESKVV